MHVSVQETIVLCLHIIIMSGEMNESRTPKRTRGEVSPEKQEIKDGKRVAVLSPQYKKLI